MLFEIINIFPAIKHHYNSALAVSPPTAHNPYLHRNNKDAAPINKLAPGSLNTSQTFQHKHTQCSSGWSLSLTPILG